MPNVEKQRERLISLLKELFQLDQPDLDFGFYRIMHAKADQVTKFLEEDLLSIIRKAFGDVDEARIAEVKAAYDAARKQAIEFGSPDPDAAEPVKKAKAAYEAAKDSGSNEGDVYDHLYRFFERYYDSGDFMSRRYFARETDGKAAPYAVPYDGREVYLHWANRDQYYIKTSEYLTNFTFDPTQAKEFQARHGALFDHKPLKVHCRIVSASEGEHNNVKASDQTERYFIIHEPESVKITTGDRGEPELVIQFQYRPDPEKTGQDGTWRKKRLAEAADKLKALLPELDCAGNFVTALMTPAPTETEKDRTLLEKYLAQYTGRNTMDYFIHKDLGGFLRRELDFYIKNEVMRLDDIESADAPRVETYLAKVKVLRRIAQHLIDFLAQLEDFQKRLWLKQKFIVDTQYCITLDRIPEEFYPEIAVNEAQREEWVRLFGIDELVEYSMPLTVEFLKANDKLLIDTALFGADFRDQVIAEMQGLDVNANGLFINSENAGALRLIRGKYAEGVQCIYIDPPYNTGGDGFAYKDSYQHSSWLSMIEERLRLAKSLLPDTGVLFASIDHIERNQLENVLDLIFERSNRVEELIWVQNTTKNQSPTYSTNHEYIACYAKSLPLAKAQSAMFRETKPGLKEIRELIAEANPAFPEISEFEGQLRALFKRRKNEIKSTQEEHDDVLDDWKGVYNYNRAEYRDRNGKFVKTRDEAQKAGAQIWVWREDNPSMPQIKEDSQKAEFRDPKSPEFRFYKPLHPVTGKPCTPPKRGWAWPLDPHGRQKNCFSELAADHRIAFGDDEKKIPQTKRFLHEVETNVSKSVVEDFTDGEKELTKLFGATRTFGGAKPTTLINRLIGQSDVQGGTVLDFFAGSGTTAHATLQRNRIDHEKQRSLLVEAGAHFDTVLLPRIKKVSYSGSWDAGKPVSRDGLSQTFKYIRVESYEDALNNLSLRAMSDQQTADEAFRRDYMLRYWLDFETKGSPSLLNIEWFDDPTAYKLKIKKPGTDEYVEKAVDLVETFNWLIGLHVEHLDRWRGYDAAFKPEVDPELPEDTNTRLMLDGALKETDDGAWRFRKVEGYTLRTPGDHNDREKALVVWRKLTGDLEQDNLMLDEWFRKYRLSAQDTEFDVIYVNGSNNLPNLRQAEETWKVRLIEEAFHRAMWDVEG